MDAVQTPVRAVSLTTDILLEADGPNAVRRGEPVTCGLPWPRGSLQDPGQLVMRDAAGTRVPLQARVLDRWPDGSVRWALLDWLADADGPTAYHVEVGRADDAAPDTALTVTRDGAAVVIDTGAACFEMRPGADFPFASVAPAGRPAETVTPRLTIEALNGVSGVARVRTVSVEESGPVRCRVRIDCGGVGRTPAELGEVFADLHFTAGSATVRMHVTLRNPRRAVHTGGLWDLGDAGSLLLRDVTLAVPLPGGAMGSVRISPEVGAAYEAVAGDLELYQDSSGGENWRSHNHLDRRRVVPTRFRGYRLRAGGDEREGLRATPAVAVGAGGAARAVAVPQFWENFPKAVEALGDTLLVRLFPGQSDGGHELQGGEQKTHVVHIAFGPDGVTDGPLDWCRRPLVPHAPPAWYAASGALPYLTPKADDPNAGYLALADLAVEGPDTFAAKREVIDEYGWRHFGDIYGDHEAVFARGGPPLTSHYNNQYDVVNGFAQQFLRSGDRRWFGPLRDLAAHVIDIDVYHTSRDRTAYNRGLFWHTYHYVDADTGTHRSYPARAGVCGGGPSCEHNYTSGLVLYHFLTGDPLARETALDSARWVIDIDDGAQTPLRWLAGGRTGFASSSGNPLYHGPGRGVGNSLNALVDGHRLTGDPRFLAKADELIRRSTHPADDIARLDLLDAERRWYYTVYLQALGKYLDHKAELGERDRAADYAREVLLHYARWMAEHERPYLDVPERLEYPTETWAAQDMRKCEVFQLAWRYADRSDERARFRERAEFFFGYVCRTLGGMPTRSLCRPVVLLLSYGHSHAWFRARFASPEAPPLPPAAPPYDHGRPATFVPQKVVFLRRAKRIALGMVVAGLAGAVALAWRVFGG
jgi:hypothetical protein